MNFGMRKGKRIRKICEMWQIFEYNYQWEWKHRAEGQGDDSPTSYHPGLARPFFSWTRRPICRHLAPRCKTQSRRLCLLRTPPSSSWSASVRGPCNWMIGSKSECDNSECRWHVYNRGLKLDTLAGQITIKKVGEDGYLLFLWS